MAYWTDIVNSHDPPRLFRPPPTNEGDAQHLNPFSRLTCFDRNIREDCLLLKVAERGIDPFGSVAYAILKGKVSLTTATLRKRYSSFWHEGTNTLDLSSCKLTLGAESIAELPSWADYALATQGPGNLPNGSELTLLSVHPRIFLVLLETGVGFSKVFQYRRVGITRIPEDMVNEYRIDWIEFLEETSFTIV